MDMKMCYALQPGFYQTFSKAGDITVLFHEMQEQQRNKILIAIDVASLQKSAEAFFQKGNSAKRKLSVLRSFFKILHL